MVFSPKRTLNLSRMWETGKSQNSSPQYNNWFSQFSFILTFSVSFLTCQTVLHHEQLKLEELSNFAPKLAIPFIAKVMPFYYYIDQSNATLFTCNLCTHMLACAWGSCRLYFDTIAIFRCDSLNESSGDSGLCTFKHVCF